MADTSEVFKPHRGSVSTMNSTKANTILEEGELFVEYPDAGIGKGYSRIKFGDGVTAYSSLPYAVGHAATVDINGNALTGYIKDLSIVGKVITFTRGDATTGTLTTQDTTYSLMTGATDSGNGTAGLVPAPDAGGQSTKYLRADGTWVVPPDTNTTYTNATTSADGLMSSTDKTKLNGISEGAEVNQNSFSTVASGLNSFAATSKSDAFNITGGTNISVSLDTANKNVVISSTIPATYDNATTSTAGLMSATDKTKLDGIATGAEVNQNAYSNIVVGETTIAADAKEDSLTMIAGSNITLTPDATADSITITATDTTYSNATTSTAGLMSSTDKTKLDGISEGAEVNQFGFSNVSDGTNTIASTTKTDTLKIVAGSNVTVAADNATKTVTISGTTPTYADATTTTSGLMSATDKTKLDGITANANHVVVEQGLTSGTTVGTISVDGTATTLYAPTATDENVTNTLATTTKAYITGTTSATTNTGTQVFDTGVYLGTTAGELVANKFTGALSGNANTATKLAASKNIAISGAVTGTATAFDGSSDISITTTSIDATKLSGIVPIENIPPAAIERLYIAATDTVRLALTTADIQNGDTVKVTNTGLMYFVKDQTQLGGATPEAAFEEYTASSASSVPWSGITGTPSLVNGVKGSAETKYRTGNVNITAANIGLGSVNNTADSAKSVASAATLTTARTIAISGGVTGTATSFNGSANISIPVTAVDATKLSGTASISTTGNAATATNATNDSAGQQISTTYIKSLSASGTTVTYTKGDNTTGTITTQDTTYSAATTTANGLMSSTDKTKLDGITAGADNVAFTQSLTSGTAVGTITINGTATTLYCQTNTNTTYSAMTGATSSAAGTSGLVPAPAAGKQVSFLRGDGTWVVPTDTTYSAATTSAAGLMSATDKTKLDGITTSADAVAFTQSLTSGTAVGTITINGTATTLYAPSTDTADTKVTNTLATTTKAYITGTTTSTTNTGTLIFDTGVYLGTTAGSLYATTFTGALSGNASTASSAATLTTARTIAISGGVTGTATSFNGSANISIPVTAVDSTYVNNVMNFGSEDSDTFSTSSYT